MSQPIFRFAPSPNGRLHLGHAYSALLNQQMAKQNHGRLLLRVEDTDLLRCTPVLEQRMLEDLVWLGIKWDEPPRRQSDHLATYYETVETLQDANLVYPAFMSRSQVRAIIARHEENGNPWPRDPDGVPHYPGDDRNLDLAERRQAIANNEPYALRLNMEAALKFIGNKIFWDETGTGPNKETGQETGAILANPKAWGDIVLSRKDAPASYHLASVVDDAIQGVTHVVRGRDLFWSTSVHRLLQELLGYTAPVYFHHELILDDDGRKLSKSRNDTAIAQLRTTGATLEDIKKMIGFTD